MCSRNRAKAWRPSSEGIAKALASEALVPLRALNETVQDMAGNVCELVAGLWSPRYGQPPGDNPNTQYHVCRGGSLNNRDRQSLEATFRRHGYNGDSTDELTGVRCAANVRAP